jgi:uncharacterized protein
MAAEQGDTDAQYRLGIAYGTARESPKITLKRPGGSVRLPSRGTPITGMQRSSSTNSVLHTTLAGESSRDRAEAARWFRKAAEQGHVDAQYNLGDAYYYGQGVPQDYAEAAWWYRKAAEQGHASAQHDLGYLHYYGQGSPSGLRRSCEVVSQSC